MRARRKCVEVKIGNIVMGGNNPIWVQSMTNTNTADVDKTVTQILELVAAGSELVRFTVKDDADATAVASIKEKLLSKNCTVPLIGDFHYNGHLLLTKFPDCALALDKYRINPGNVGFGDAHDRNFKMMVDCAIQNQKPVRIGVNWGSLDQKVLAHLMDENAKKQTHEQKTPDAIVLDAMVTSALESAKMAESYGLKHDQIVLSVKVSKVPELIHVYKMLSGKTNLPLHLGLTEAGMGNKGIVASTAGLSVLLQEGIGDTIRVSLTPEPGAPRSEEVKVARQILQLNDIRKFMPTVTSCPGCGRTTSTLFQEMTRDINSFLEERMPQWKAQNYTGVESMTVAVMGCIVNGPGESKEANIGLSLPGDGEDPICPVYIDGKRVKNLKGASKIQEFKQMIEEYVISHYKKNGIN